MFAASCSSAVALRRQRSLGRRNEFGQFAQTVGADKQFSGRRAIVVCGKPIPAAQLAIARDQSLAGCQRFAAVGIDHTHQRQAGAEFDRGFDMIDKAGAFNIGDIRASTQPAPPAAATDTGIGIVAKRRRQCAFIARLGLDLIDGLIAACLCKCALKRRMFGQQGRQFGFRAGKRALCRLALVGKFGALCVEQRYRGRRRFRLPLQ